MIGKTSTPRIERHESEEQASALAFPLSRPKHRAASELWTGLDRLEASEPGSTTPVEEQSAAQHRSVSLVSLVVVKSCDCGLFVEHTLN